MKKAIVIILACLAVFACGKHPAAKAARSEVDSLLVRVDSSMQAAHDRLEKIAASKPAQQRDLATLFIYMREVRPIYVGVDFFADQHGVAVTQNNMQGDLTMYNFWNDLSQGFEVFGASFVEPFYGRPAVLVCLPVKTEAGIVGYVGSVIYVEGLRQRLMDEVPMAPGHVFFVLDDQTRTLLDSGDLALTFDEPLQQPNESLQKAIEEMMASEKGTVSYTWDGVTKETEFRQSELLGWRVAVSHPVEQK